MVTNTPKQDHQKKAVLIAQLQRVCLDCGNYAALMRDGWRCTQCGGKTITEMTEVQAADHRGEIESGEYLKTNPARSNLNLRFMTFEQMFIAAADGTLIDGTDSTSSASRRDAGFGDIGPF